MKAGDTFAGRYRIDGEVGAGGMGAVYAVTHLVTKRRGALKVILGSQHDAVAVQRFGREAELAGQLDTKHVVSVFDAGATPEGTPFLVMELLRGEDLSKLVARCGRVAEDLALRIASQCAAGLSRAHARGIVHRDIKTANVFLADGEGDEITVKVLDFGIAKLRGDGSGGAEAHSLTRTGSLLGSPLYMSPEQALGERSLDHRADLWSLGVTLYEMLCGRTPFHDEESFGRLLMAICHTDVPPIDRFASDLRPEVRALVGRLLQRDRDARFQSADELRATLLALTGGTDAISSGELGRTSALVGGSTSATDGSLDETLPAEPFMVAEGRSGASLGSHDTSRERTAGRSRLPLAMLGLVTVVAGGAGGYAMLRGGVSRGQVDTRPPSPATPSDRPPNAEPVVDVVQPTGADSAGVEAVAATSTTNSARPPTTPAASAGHAPPTPAPRASTRPSAAPPVAAPAQPPPPQPGLTATPKFE